MTTKKNSALIELLVKTACFSVIRQNRSRYEAGERRDKVKTIPAF